MLGIGAMLGLLSGNELTGKAIKSSLGKIIEKVDVNDDVLTFIFNDSSVLNIRDDGQSCCEHRYMSCDDDLSYFNGSTLLDLQLKDVPDVEDEYGVHEIQFLDVITSNGVFQVATHNEHNGYYGGFDIEATYTEPLNA